MKWKTKSLGDFCTLSSGGTPSKENAGFWTGDVPFVSARDLKTDFISSAALHISREAVEQSATKLAPVGSLLMLVRGMGLANGIQIGEVTSPVAFNQDIRAISPPLESVRPRFLLLALKHTFQTEEGEQALSSAAHGTLKIDGDVLRRLQVPLPPLAEQHRIVGVLDEAFASVATAKANTLNNLQNARAVFESHLQSVYTKRGVGWVDRSFSELCDIKHGYAFDGEFFRNEGEYVLLTPGNFYERGGYRDRGEKQKYYTGEIPRDYIVNEGDLLVAMTEQAAGLLGSPILVPESDKFLHNQRLGLVTKKPGVPWSNEFFFHVFNTQSVRKAIHASASGVKVRHTSPTKIGEVVITFPTSLEEQTRIVSTLTALTEETQRLVDMYERKLAALDALKQSLLHEAFSGRL